MIQTIQNTLDGSIILHWNEHSNSISLVSLMHLLKVSSRTLFLLLLQPMPSLLVRKDVDDNNKVLTCYYIASCCNEAFKIATGSPFLDNYMMYTGNEGIYTYTFQHQRKPECPVCGKIASSIQIDKSMKLEELIEQVKERPDVYVDR